MYNLETFLQEIAWGEGLRWHNGKLWASDIFGRQVLVCGLSLNDKKTIDIPGMPSGLGFLPDERLLIVSGNGKLLVLEDEELTEYADLTTYAVGINDMVVNHNGNAYVGGYGYDITKYNGGPAEGYIIMVSMDQEVKKVGTELICPNGMVITPDGNELIVADTIAKKLVSFRITPDGSLGEPKIWADMEYGPDGICMDAEGAIWAATPRAGEVIRVCKGGVVTDRINCKDTPLCCVLGGEDLKSLFIVTVPVHNELSAESLGGSEVSRRIRGSVILKTKVQISGIETSFK